MKRRNLLKSIIAGGIATSGPWRRILAATTPAFSEVNATTLGGGEAVLGKSTVSGLQSALKGTLLQSHSPGYDAARTLWNAMIDHRPALIAQCVSAQDVAAVISGWPRALPTSCTTSTPPSTAGRWSSPGPGAGTYCSWWPSWNPRCPMRCTWHP